MDRFRSWLEQHALGDYCDLLVSHSVDLEIISDLSESDFAELGLSLGDRKRMMRAIRALSRETDTIPGLAEAPARFEHGAPNRPAEAGEKLHLTMIFVDLVGSTTLSNELSLEDYRDVIHRYQIFTLKRIRQHHGHVAQFIGDAVTAYFGYPTAAEDDAERAVRAALDICEGIDTHLALPNHTLSVRIGIATGDLVVERQSMREGLAFGDTPNLAARIMSATKPGTIAISERTRRLLGAAIECESLGHHQLKGFQNPETIWQVKGVLDAGLRFRARQKGAMLPMVDRKDELRLLNSRWQTACRGQTQTALLSGEAGIGKSRIVEALTKLIDADGGVRLNFQCSPHHRDHAFFPLVSLIRFHTRIRRGDTPEQQASKLDRLLKLWFDPDDFTTARRLFANLLGIPSEAVGLDTAIAPEHLKTRLQQTLIDLAIRLSAKRPVLILFEDLHWADPSTEDLITLLIERLDQHRVMILCTSRPEYKFRWAGQDRVTSMTIARLENHFAVQMMRNAFSGGVASPEIESQILRKSDGVPLFVEEMSRMVRRRLDEPDAADKDDLFNVPSTLKDLLRAKIDALVTAREIVPVCAAIGRTIYPAMVAAVTNLSLETASAQLDYLAEVDILIAQGNKADRSYTFRHALIQDAAYDLMLDSRARKLHRKIAKVMVEAHPDLARQQPDLLAQHYTRAILPAQARDAWRDAATLAASRSATEETIRHLENALRQNEQIESPEIRLSEEIELRKMFNVALNTRAFGSSHVFDNMNRLHELILGSGAPPEDTFLALHVQLGAQLMLGDTANSLTICEKLEAIADECDDITMQAITVHNRGMVTFLTGQFSQAIKYYDTALLLRQRSTQADVLRYHAADIRAVDLAMRCWALSLRGDDPPAVRKAITNAAEDLASETHEFSRCFALNILATSYQPLGDTHALLALVAQALKISDEHNFQYWHAWSTIIQAWARARSGETSLGISELNEGLQAYLATGSTQITQFARTLLADAYMHSGDIEKARTAIDEIKANQHFGSISYHLGLVAGIEAELPGLE